ncbi:hypothetical protein PspLS_00951 [Pyricularia sp. CBS 133598]|nr:hypothetical protein PspLS_00951 [Pyricularia sp. CBS 133598]
MALSWKSFDFFDVQQVQVRDDETRAFFESNEISSVCSGSDSLFLGSNDGHVRIVGPSWKIVRSFRAYGDDDDGGPARQRITHMRQVEGTSLLVTIAEDLSNEPVLKVWALDRPVKKTGLPTCLSMVQINNAKKQFPISAFTATDDLSQVAVGFANGSVTVIRGDLIYDKGTRQRIIHDSEEPITGIEMRTEDGESGGKVTTLFIATTARILKIVIFGKGQGHPPKTVEDSGCGVGCMTVDSKTGDIVVARDDAIYYYTLEGRGAPRAYECPKSLISTYGDYLALVSPPANSASSGSGQPDSMRRRFGASPADTLFNASTFSFLETDLKIVAHTQSVISSVQALFQVWGDMYMLTSDGKISRYHEKPLQQRLEMLYQRNLYLLAIELAQKSDMDARQQNVIFRKFGDHLYQKGDYDGAMTQYIKAIDSTEPSRVIRKFLDTQRIHNLISYLEQLHENRKATADHTTLLLNCYAKLKDVDKLEAFIKSPGDLRFDLDTAISMCRQGGYYEQAAYLAQKHGETDLVVDILIEDSKKYDDALDFIWHHTPETAYRCLMKYARVLIEHCPKEATQLFIDYYTGNYQPRVDAVQVQEAAAPSGAGGLAAGAVTAVQNLTHLIPLPYMSSTSATATPNGAAGGKSPASDVAGIKDLTPQVKFEYNRPAPRTAFSSFIDHADEFIIFLEACLKEQSLSDEEKTDVYTTLFEMYLHKAAEQKNEDSRGEWEAKAKALISVDGIDKSKTPMIDNSSVLLLSHLSDFRDGTTLVKEQSGLLFDIFRSYTLAKDTRGAIRALRKYGPEEPQLYPAALAYLTSDPRVLDEAGTEELTAVLQRIDKDKLMAPLQVVQTLSKGDVATVGMLKPYLRETIERERKGIAADRRRAANFKKETAQRKAEMADLGSKPAVFQATRCNGCALPLELPAVHFLCKHSFHQRCLKRGVTTDVFGDREEDSTGECPICAKDNDTIRAMRQAQVENAGKHDLFKDALEHSEDRFGTVADWFGRGVMSVPNEEA